MAETLTPMIHVPDVAETVRWYEAAGFTVTGRHEEDGRATWARVALGDAGVMFNIDGRPSDAWRREADLYIATDRLDDLWARMKDAAEVVEPPHETEYGMREFIVRDLNRFWLTFGQPTG